MIITKKKMKLIEEQFIQKGKNEAQQEFQKTIDYIDDERNKYSTMSEKDLLVEIIMGLASHARRLDRIEENVSLMMRLKDVLTDVNEQMKTIQQTINGTVLAIGVFKGVVEKYEIKQSQIIENMQQSDALITELTTINRKLSLQFDSLKKELSEIEQSEATLLSASKSLNQVFETYNESSITNLLRMSNTIHEMAEKIEEMQSDFETSIESIKEDFADNDDIKSKIEEVLSNLNNIDESITGFYGIDSNIHDMNRALDRIEESITGYSGISSEIDDIKNSLDSLEREINDLER